MNFTDKWAQRMLAMSAMIFGTALLVFALGTIAPAHATPENFDPESAAPWDTGLRGSVGLGIKDNTAYFVTFEQQHNKLYKVDLDKARDWYLD